MLKTPSEINLINFVNPFPKNLNTSAINKNNAIRQIIFRIFLSILIKSINRFEIGPEKLYDARAATRKPTNEEISLIKPLKNPFKNAESRTMMIIISIIFKMKILCLQF